MCTGIEAKELATSDQTLLVLLAQSGDRGALEQLLRNAYGPLRRYVIYLAGADFADDILQGDFAAKSSASWAPPHLREPAVFRAWTFRIASRIAFSHLKYARRWQRFGRCAGGTTDYRRWSVLASRPTRSF